MKYIDAYHAHCSWPLKLSEEAILLYIHKPTLKSTEIVHPNKRNRIQSIVFSHV